MLLRGTQRYPDLQAITRKLDDLYGAGVGTLVRRVGDYQTTGLTCAFSLSNTNYHRFQVLCSFEVATFFITNKKSPEYCRISVIFMQLGKKGAVQNQYFLTERCP